MHSAEEYLAVLGSGGIELGVAGRREAIWQGVTAAAHSVGGELVAGGRVRVEGWFPAPEASIILVSVLLRTLSF